MTPTDAVTAFELDPMNGTLRISALTGCRRR